MACELGLELLNAFDCLSLLFADASNFGCFRGAFFCFRLASAFELVVPRVLAKVLRLRLRLRLWRLERHRARKRRIGLRGLGDWLRLVVVMMMRLR